MNKNIESDELKRIELEILIDFESFCENNNLRYYLAGGTLLGAVRHHGFIPWDDDIDVIMPRPDYERFLQLSCGSITKDIDVLTYQNTPNYVFPFAKAVNNKTVIIEKAIGETHPTGVWIDIFPMDGVPDTLEGIKKHFQKIYFERGFHRYSYSLIKEGKNTLKTIRRHILMPPCKVIGFRYFVEKLDQTAQKYDFSASRNCAVTVWGYGKKEIVPKEDFVKTIKVSFEGYQFNAPQNYDLYLRNLYGDYWQLPPENERTTQHDFVAYWKE